MNKTLIIIIIYEAFKQICALYAKIEGVLLA